MTPRKDTADLIEWAEARGWTVDGIRGNGHPALRWTDGTLHTLASTAGDWRNTRNAKAELARIDGQALPHVKRGKARHVPADGFSMEAAKREQRRRAEAEAERAAEDAARTEALEAATAEARFRDLARASWLRRYTALRAHPATRAQASHVEPHLLRAVAHHREAQKHLAALRDEAP